MSPDADQVSRHPFRVLLALVLLGALGSGYQLTSNLFYCGFKGADPEILSWTLLAGIQSLLFLSAAWSDRARRIYRITQWVALAVCVYVLYQLSAIHARSLLTAVLGLGIYATCAHALDQRRGAGPTDWSRLLCEGVLFLLAVLVIQSVLTLPVLYSRDMVLGDRIFSATFALSCVAAFFMVRAGARGYAGDAQLVQVPPILLLVMVLLRYKQHDGAYDTLFYKGTIPQMLEGWRTALTGITDHTLLGTNLQEIINAQLRILDGSQEPRVLGMLAFMGLWLLAPVAGRVIARLLPVGSGGTTTAFVINVAALLLVSLSEPLTGSGTSYQEPFQMLLLAAGIAAGPAGWVFLSAAVAVKATALIFIPLLLLLNLAGMDAERVKSWMRDPAASLRTALSAFRARRQPGTTPYVPVLVRQRRRAAAVCALIACIVFGEQLVRNQVMAGRLLAPSDMFARITDPQNRMLAEEGIGTAFDVVKRRPAFDNMVGTLMQIGTLDKWMPTEEHGFHALPSSRLPLVAAGLGLFALLCIFRAPLRRWAALSLLWLALFAVYVQMFSQGRHMAAASFAAVAVLALAPAFFGHRGRSKMYFAAATLAFAALAIGDQMVGNFINVGWDCNRRMSARALPALEKAVASPLDEKLATIAADYLSKAPLPRRVVPTILCDYAAGPKRYMGVHYAFASVTHELLGRYLAADPARAGRLDRAALVVCVDMWHLTRVKPEHLAGFRAEARIGTTQIFVSEYLSNGGAAEQLVPSGFPLPSALRPYLLVRDFSAGWQEAHLADESVQQTPSGRGVLEMDVEGVQMPTLVAPNSLIFRGVRVLPGDRIFVEAGLPHKQSDGLALELRLESADATQAAPIARKSMLKRRRWTGAAWHTLELLVPEQFAGSVNLTISATSEGGDPDADWVSFRKLRLERRSY